MKLRTSRSEAPDINLTPLIDVVFLLLIFFMVSTTFDREAELTIELPQAEVEPGEPDPDVIEVSIDAEGRYYVNGRPLVNSQVRTIKQALSKEIESGESPPVVINADAGTPHQAVIAVMDAARQMGLVNLSFPVRAAPEGSQ